MRLIRYVKLEEPRRSNIDVDWDYESSFVLGRNLPVRKHKFT